MCQRTVSINSATRSVSDITPRHSREHSEAFVKITSYIWQFASSCEVSVCIHRKLEYCINGRYRRYRYADRQLDSLCLERDFQREWFLATSRDICCVDGKKRQGHLGESRLHLHRYSSVYLMTVWPELPPNPFPLPEDIVNVSIDSPCVGCNTDIITISEGPFGTQGLNNSEWVSGLGLIPISSVFMLNHGVSAWCGRKTRIDAGPRR